MPVARMQAEGSSMERLVRQAVEWHPSIDEAANRVKDRQARVSEARAGYLPGVKASIRATPIAGGDTQTGPGPKLHVAAQQMLFDFGKVDRSVREGLADEELSRVRLISKADSLAHDTALAVVEAQRNRNLMELATRRIGRVEAIVGLVGDRHESGASAESDRVQALSRLESARASRLQFEARHRQQLANLANLAGRVSDVGRGVPEWLLGACNLPEPQWAAVAEVQMAHAEVERARAKVESARVEMLPTVALEAGASYAIETAEADDPLHYNVGLHVTSPTLQGSAALNRVQSAGFVLQEAEAALQRARVSAWKKYEAARQQVEPIRDLRATLMRRADIMKKARDLYEMQYVDLGTRTILNVLDAEQELYEAEVLATNAEHDLHRLYVNCLFHSGKLRERFGVDEVLARRLGAK